MTTTVDTCPETWTLSEGTRLKMRHMTPGDADVEQAFVRGLSPKSRYFRFHCSLNELSAQQLHDLTHLDPDVSTALIVLYDGEHGEEEIAVARYIIDPDRSSCEMAIVVGDAWQKRGIGTRLLNALIKHAQAQGVTRIYDPILKTDIEMRDLARHLGFKEIASPDDPSIIIVSKELATHPMR